MGLVIEGHKPEDALETAAQQVCLDRTARASAARSSSLRFAAADCPSLVSDLFLDLLKPEELGRIRVVIAQGNHIPVACWVGARVGNLKYSGTIYSILRKYAK